MYGAYTIQGERNFHGDWTWAPRSWNNTSGRCPRNVTNAHSLELCLLRNWHKSDCVAEGNGWRSSEERYVFIFFISSTKENLSVFNTRIELHTHTHTHTPTHTHTCAWNNRTKRHARQLSTQTKLLNLKLPEWKRLHLWCFSFNTKLFFR